MLSMRKQFWITAKQFLLYLLLSQGIMALGMIIVMIIAMPKGLDEDAMMEFVANSAFAKGAMVLGYIVTIAVFLGKRYVKLSTGRIERSRLWVMAGMAALVSWGWMFTEAGLLTLVDAEKLFPDEAEELEQFSELLGGIYGFVCVGLLVPIAEEIGFRGVLLGGLLRMRFKPWVAIIVSALVFAYFHGTYLQLVGTTVFGIITGWLYWRTRSLIPGMIIHIVNNSSVVALETAAPDYEPGKKVCVLFILVFLPMLAIGLKWFKEGKFKSGHYYDSTSRDNAEAQVPRLPFGDQ